MARTLCWDVAGTSGTVPATHAALWRVASALSRPRTVTRAYLNPVMPAAWLAGAVNAALAGLAAEFDSAIRGGLAAMPDYSLEDGTLLDGRQHGTRAA